MSNKVEEKNMKPAAKRGLKPKRRFPEFRDAGDWEKKKISQIADFYKGKGISKSDIVADGNQPCIRYGELYTLYSEVIGEVKSKTNSPSSDLFLSKKNDVIIPASGETKIDIATASCVTEDNVALGGDLNIIRSRENGIFLSYYLNGALRNKIAEIAQGDAVVHLYPTQLKLLDIAIPSDKKADKKEQQKIADCLASLDELIAAQDQKLDTLKVYKNGLMQQLFPAEGETLPKLRFPEFRDAGEWGKQRVSSLLKRVSNPVIVNLDEIYRQIGIRSHGKGIFHKQHVSGKELGNKRVFWVEEDAFIVNIVFAWEQAVANTTTTEKGMIASHRFPMYKAKTHKSDVIYIKYFFLTRKGKHLLWLASPGGAGRNKTLGQKDFENLEFILPEKAEEQTKIAECLSSIDELLATQTHKLDSLKAHKKGLMQQLFPALDEVQG